MDPPLFFADPDPDVFSMRIRIRHCKNEENKQQRFLKSKKIHGTDPNFSLKMYHKYTIITGTPVPILLQFFCCYFSTFPSYIRIRINSSDF